MADKASEIISQYESSGLHMTVEEQPGAVVAHMAGDLVLGGSSDLFRRKMEELAAKPGVKKIVLDLTDLRYVNSGGLGTLVAAFTSVRKAGISLVLANPGSRFKDVLQITRLAKVFPVVGSVQEALAL
jgi:anti-sigma B factor antagonist